MANGKPNSDSETQKRKRYMQIVSRKRKYTKFEIESWKKRDQEDERNKEISRELDADALRHFNEI